jgi:hypothetical protein
MIKTQLEYAGTWMVWDTKTLKSGFIVRIQEYGFLASKKPRYRVDINGKTVVSLIESFSAAKKVAREHLRA